MKYRQGTDILVMPWSRKPVAGQPICRSGYDSRPVPVQCMMERVALWHIFL